MRTTTEISSDIRTLEATLKNLYAESAKAHEVEQLAGKLADRFMGLSLPDDFNPDGGITFKRLEYNGNPYPMPTGTNLFTASQAKAIFIQLLSDQ